MTGCFPPPLLSAEIFGADRSLAKPFKLSSLVSVVDEMLRARKSA